MSNTYEIEIFETFLEAMKTGYLPANESSEKKEKRLKCETDLKDKLGQRRSLKTMYVYDDASRIYSKGCSFSTYVLLPDLKIFENDTLTETTICLGNTPLRICNGTPFKIHEALKTFREKAHKGLW